MTANKTCYVLEKFDVTKHDIVTVLHVHQNYHRQFKNLKNVKIIYNILMCIKFYAANYTMLYILF